MFLPAVTVILLILQVRTHPPIESTALICTILLRLSNNQVIVKILGLSKSGVGKLIFQRAKLR